MTKRNRSIRLWFSEVASIFSGSYWIMLMAGFFHSNYHVIPAFGYLTVVAALWIFNLLVSYGVIFARSQSEQVDSLLEK